MSEPAAQTPSLERDFARVLNAWSRGICPRLARLEHLEEWCFLMRASRGWCTAEHWGWQ